MILAAVLVISGINIHDFLFDPSLPWREGDFAAVMLRLGIAGLVAATALFLLRRHHNRRSDG